MDRNSILGISLIAAIFIVWGILNKPDQEGLKRTQERNDSIALVLKKQELENEIKAIEEKQKISSDQPVRDNIIEEQPKQEYGIFSNEATGENKIYTLENELIKVEISQRGGRPYSVELKKYKTFDSLPVILFNGDSSLFGINFYSQSRHINTNDLYFTPSLGNNTLAPDGTKTLSMRLNAGNDGYIEYRYTLQPGKYQVDMEIELDGLKDLTTQRTGFIDLDWMIFVPQQEKGKDNELQYTSLYYKPFKEKVDFITVRAKKEMQSENFTTQLEWIAYKDQFFSTVIMADNAFSDALMEMHSQPEESKYLKKFKSTIGIPFDGSKKQLIPLHFYFGPNKYNLLKKQYGDKDLKDLVSVGKNIIKWINQIVIIKLFDFLNKYFLNYGIIILIMTVIIKLALLPLTFKSYLSTAKMRVLKPQIDEINSKIPKDKPMERQQATMALYKKVGVSPLGGCLPMLLQMPILFAMFRFFPTSIELRQQGFLWAHDLSTYDAIFEWQKNIPLLSQYYGNHISLFTILMTVSTILSMKLSNQTAATPQMPGMQTMMYIMPVMFMFFLNKFSSGLTYYYFLANVITIGQNYLFNYFIDEDELLKKLQSKKAKVVKKSNFQQRLEKMAKQRGR